MSILSVEIEKRVRTLKVLQKDVAVAFHDALGKRAKKGATVDYKTVGPKFSKLLKGSREGEAFFFASEARVAALADALRWKPADLYSLRTSSRDHRVLVLHPNLRPECRDFLVRQEKTPGASYSCVTVAVESDDDAARREAIRAAAAAAPGCMVIADGTEDDAYLAGAQIPVTRLQTRPRGWSLVEAPDLVPQPPPDPPQTADKDGMPMANPPGFLAALEGEIDKAERSFGQRWDLFGSQKIFESVRASLEYARRVEREPTFRVDHLLYWLRRDALPEAKIRLVAARPPGYDDPKVDLLAPADAYAALRGNPEETLLWEHDGHALAFGPNAEAASRVLGGSGPARLKTPTSLVRLSKYLKTGNPWQHERKRWKALCAEVTAECGWDMARVYDAWLQDIDVEKRDRETDGDTVPKNEKKEPRTWTVKLDDEKTNKKTRAALWELSRREFTLTSRATSVPFVLDAVAVAPLICLPLDGRDVIHVVANLGAGNVLRIRAMRFSGEQREPLRLSDPAGYYAQLDGGDVHVWIECWSNGLLDGQPLSRVLDRRRQALRRQQDDRYWDDD